MRTQDMAPEQIEEAKKLATPEEMLAYARDNGIDLTDDEMDSIAGGYDSDSDSGKEKACPYCGSTKINTRNPLAYECTKCGKKFERVDMKWVPKKKN